jgi:putative copper export protein
VDALLASGRITTFAGAAFLFGLGPVYALVLHHGFAAATDTKWRRGHERMARRLALEADAAFAGLIVGSLLTLLGQVRDAAQRHGASVRASDVVDTLGTGFGGWTALRLVLTVAMFAALRGQLRDRLARAEGARAMPAEDRTFWIGWTVFGTALLASIAMTSHAAAGPRPLLAVPVNLAHLATSAVWLVGICVLATALPVALATRDARSQLHLFSPTLARFARLAFLAVLATAVTGALNALAVLDDVGALRTTAYGQTLLVKVWLFAWIVGLGGLNHFVLLRRLQAAATPQEGAARMRVIGGSVAVEFLFGVLLLGATAVLTGLSPTSTG